MTIQFRPPLSFSYLLCLLSLFIVTGCASVATTAPRPEAELRTTAATAERQYQPKIQISGRINIQYQQADKPQNMPGNFEWEQDAQGIRINLLSQLGQTLARITQTANGAVLEQSGKEPRQAADIDQLLQTTLGWSLPVAGMRDWLQGFVATNGNKAAALKAVDQTVTTEGWTLRYASWQADGSFPKRIDLQRYTEQAGDVSIRIVIDEWK